MPKPAATPQRIRQLARHGRIELKAQIRTVTTRPGWKNRPVAVWVLSRVRLSDGGELIGDCRVDVPRAGLYPSGLELPEGSRLRFMARVLEPAAGGRDDRPFHLSRITELHKREGGEWLKIKVQGGAPRSR